MIFACFVIIMYMKMESKRRNSQKRKKKLHDRTNCKACTSQMHPATVSYDSHVFTEVPTLVQLCL